jgi:hypothetical protein
MNVPDVHALAEESSSFINEEYQVLILSLADEFREVFLRLADIFTALERSM